jgi:hypothetical protein
MLLLWLTNRPLCFLVVMVMQQESTKRAVMEQRLHSQLLLQNESMVAMELKLLRLEAKVERRDAAQRQQRSRNNAVATIRTIDEVESHSLSTGTRASEPTNIAVHSSGASLASGVTEELGEDDEEEVGSQQSSKLVVLHLFATCRIIVGYVPSNFVFRITAPTLGSRPAPRITGGALGSILLNPMMGETSVLGHSLSATRGDFDGNSSLGTSVTGSTMTSTILPSRGESIRGRYFLQDPDSRRTTSALTDDTFFSSANEARPRSRSNSPLSVQSQAMASEASQSTAIMSSVAVAAPRSRRATRMEASLGEESRPLANRVVSFTTDILQNQPQNMNENCDSITMPDELDNLSEVADAFSSSGRSWREDYEARLDALQKRWANE